MLILTFVPVQPRTCTVDPVPRGARQSHGGSNYDRVVNSPYPENVADRFQNLTNSSLNRSYSPKFMKIHP